VKFATTDYIDEVDLGIVPLDVFGVIFDDPYL
jgi:hypothetical protein